MAITKPEARHEDYDKPAGGWGALNGVHQAFAVQNPGKRFIPILDAVKSLLKTNKPRGYDCSGCAWPDKGGGIGPDTCEQGQKATAWESTDKEAGPDFFAANQLADLRDWTDFELENEGRLTSPLRYDAASDRYLQIGWDEAMVQIARALHAMDPHEASFYTSGRTSNEAAFLWQLVARAYGSPNIPDSANLCHAPSGYAMKEQIGVGKGTCTLDDFSKAKLIIVVGQNSATNHPRMMGELYEAVAHGAVVVVVNPLQERGFVNFADPKNPKDMLTGKGRQVAADILQVKCGGDLALFKGLMKRLIEMEDAGGGVLDWPFIHEHCEHFDALAMDLRSESWARIIERSGLKKKQILKLADLYAKSSATIVTWCMGVTHHEDSPATIQTMIDLLLLKGNIGKHGAGAVPVRGHSNVQGVGTMFCTPKAHSGWINNQEAYFPGLTLNREDGLDSIQTIEGLIAGTVKAFVGLGGNFASAAPDNWRTFEALSRCELTVHVATKFNRSHCYPGKIGFVLPCLARTDIDMRAGAEQRISVEDSMSMVHESYGYRRPLSDHMMSEPAFVAMLGNALVGSAYIDWNALSNDYELIRDAIEASEEGIFHGFKDYNKRLHIKGGFRLTNWASERSWKTPTGLAQFMVRPIRFDGPIERAIAREGNKVLALMTIRSHDQFNTTIYGQDDRYRGVKGGRHVLFANANDLQRQGFKDGDYVDIRTCSEDGIHREVHGFRLIAYDIPEGSAAAYFPEATPLTPIGLTSRGTRTPASKEIPVIISAARVSIAGGGVSEPMARSAS